MARYFAYGERNEFSDMVQLPEWYLALGKTAKQRRRKFRQMLDEYAVQRGYKRDPRAGNFIGNELWVETMRGRVRRWVQECAQRKTGADPPQAPE